MQEKKLKIRELTWQIELLVNLQPNAVASALKEAQIYIDLAGGQRLNVAKAILDGFAARGFVGLVGFFTKLSNEFSLDLPGSVVNEIIKSWLSLVSLFSDEELYCSMDGDYEFSCLFTGEEIFTSTTSGVLECLMRLFDPMSLYRFCQSMDSSNPEGDLYNRRVVTQLTISGPSLKIRSLQKTRGISHCGAQ